MCIATLNNMAIQVLYIKYKIGPYIKKDLQLKKNSLEDKK